MKTHSNLLLQELDNRFNEHFDLDKNTVGCFKNILKMPRENEVTSYSTCTENSVKEMSSSRGKLTKVHDTFDFAQHFHFHITPIKMGPLILFN